MKKLTAIFLLCTFMLNLIGYRMWYFFELKAADNRMEAILDKQDYLESELITISIPLALPYQADTHDFEHITGEVSFEGKIYTYVKRKMENGYFVLLCLPHHNKMLVEQEKNELVKNSLHQSQNNSNKPGSGGNMSKFVSGEFEEGIFTLNFGNSNAGSKIFASFDDVAFFSLSISAPAQPPDYFS